MTATCCPDCFAPVAVRPDAREGRCAWCRPQPERRHSTPRPSAQSRFAAFINEHRQATQ